MRDSHVLIQNFFHRLDQFAHKRSHDFWLFESSIWMHMFASSLISVFIPILMLRTGFSLSEVLLFYIIYHAVNIPANILGRFSVQKLGAKTTIVIATIINILFFIVYSQISTWEHLLILALLFALYDGLYYVASLYVFIGSTKDPENTGENTGILHLVVRSASLLGPIIGSSLLLVSDGSRLLVVSIVVIMFILSLIPLLKIKEIKTKPEHKPLSFKEFFNNKREVKNHLSFGLFKIHEGVEYIIWPIFIYLTFEELGSVAILAVLVPVVSLIFSYTAGHIKRTRREQIIMIGALALAVVWLGRLIFDAPLFLYASVIATGLFGLFVLVPLDANMFLRGSERGALSAAMYRNISSMGAKLVVFVALYLAVSVFTISFQTAIAALLGLALVNYLYLHWRKDQPGESTSIPGLPKT